MKGFLAWMGTWVSGIALGEWVLQIQSFAWICAWGVLVYWLSEGAKHWIEEDV